MSLNITKDYYEIWSKQLHNVIIESWVLVKAKFLYSKNEIEDLIIQDNLLCTYQA